MIAYLAIGFSVLSLVCTPLAYLYFHRDMVYERERQLTREMWRNTARANLNSNPSSSTGNNGSATVFGGDNSELKGNIAQLLPPLKIDKLPPSSTVSSTTSTTVGKGVSPTRRYSYSHTPSPADDTQTVVLTSIHPNDLIS